MDNISSENLGYSDQHAVDTVVFYNGRASKLYLVPTLLKASIPASLAIYAGFFINWPVVLTHPHLLVEGIVKFGLIKQPLLLVAILLLTILSIMLFVRGFVVWFSNTYRITNDRVEYERGIFSKVVLNVELWRIRDTFFRRSAIQFLLGVGVIVIIATDETIPQLEIGPIRNYRKIYDSLKEARLVSGRIAGGQAMGMGMGNS